MKIFSQENNFIQVNDITLIIRKIREKYIVNLQDFACAVSNLFWGGDLGWDRPGGLELLFETVKKMKKETEKPEDIPSE